MQWILRKREQGSCDLQSLVLIILLTVLFGLSACSDLQDHPTSYGGGGATASSCVRCHTDQELLMKLAPEGPTSTEENAGEG